MNPLLNCSFCLLPSAFCLLQGLIGGGIVGLIGGLIYRPIGGGIVGLIGQQIYQLYPKIIPWGSGNSEQLLVVLGVICGLIGGIICGLIGGIIFGFDELEINKKNIPNQGIFRAVINTAIITIVITVLTYFLKKLFIFFSTKQTPVDLIFGLFLGLLVAIPISGTPAIKHFILRLILSFNGYIPWNYTKFLDYCTDRLFLQRVGGSYRFMHDLLRQHFANSYTQKN